MVPARYLQAFALLALFLGFSAYAGYLNSGMGTVLVEKVIIQGDGVTVAGLLYTPQEGKERYSAVLIAHGVSNSKEVVSGLALEAARYGFMALAVDLAGHGESSGGISGADTSLGMLAAYDYLSTHPMVNGRVAVAGHSMGAGAARSVAASRGVYATVLIGGGVGSSGNHAAQPPITSTSPPNLLIIAGEEDVLIDLPALKASLEQAFGYTQSNGDFSAKTVRMLVTFPTIHLLEPVDPRASDVMNRWLYESFYPEVSAVRKVAPPIMLMREAASVASLACLVGLLAPLGGILGGALPGGWGDPPVVRRRFLREIAVLLGWGFLGLLLYGPAMLAGSLLPFPEPVFGRSMAWWLLASAAAGLLLLVLLGRRRGEISLLSVLKGSLKLKDVALALLLGAVTYALVYGSQMSLGEKVRLLVPIFQTLTSRRAPVALQFIPFFLVFFAVEGLWLHVYRERQTAGSAAGNLLRTLLLKTGPYLLLLGIQYGLLFAGVRLLPGFAAFFVEFLWAVTPLFLVSTFTSWWLYRLTGRIGAGVILNALLFSWVCAGLFPFP